MVKYWKMVMKVVHLLTIDYEFVRPFIPALLCIL